MRRRGQIPLLTHERGGVTRRGRDLPISRRGGSHRVVFEHGFRRAFSDPRGVRVHVRGDVREKARELIGDFGTLSKNGIIAGCLLVFIPAVGEYVIPELLGGANTLMIGRVMWNEFFDNADWPMASAVTCAMVLLLLVPMAFFQYAQAKALEERR